MIIKNFNDFVNENLLLEFKQDLKPSCVIVFGGPASGKTTFVKKSLPVMFKKMMGNSFSDYKTPDADVTLKKFQREHLFDFADELLHSLSSICYNVTDITNTKVYFKNWIRNKQEEFDRICMENNSPSTDLSLIDYNFVMGYVHRFDNAAENNREKILKEYKDEFYKKYFKTVFNSDFSVRPKSNEKYNNEYLQSLKKYVEYDDDNDSGVSTIASSSVIQTTGSNVNKVLDIINFAKDTHAIYVIFLDVPEDLAVQSDKERKEKEGRGVGEAVTRLKNRQARETYYDLKKNYKEYGIWKMWHYKNDIQHGVWKTNLEDFIINKDMIGQ